MFKMNIFFCLNSVEALKIFDINVYKTSTRKIYKEMYKKNSLLLDPSTRSKIQKMSEYGGGDFVKLFL